MERCEECGFDPADLRPADMVVAIRSFGRRYRAPLMRGLAGEDLDAIVQASPGPGVWSAVEYASHVTDVFRTFDDRVLLCGDAGGFVNAYTGEGIYHAMVTGEHAGTTAADALATGDVSAGGLVAYERRWRAEVGDELADAVRVQRRLFADPALADTIIRAAALDAQLCRLFALVALGEASLRRHRFALTWRFLLARLRMLGRR